MDLATAPSLVVTDERYCIRCGYLLRGLQRGGVCPECGTEVELSLREPTLGAAAPEYVRTINRGLSLVLNGLLLTVAMMILAGVGTYLASAAGVSRLTLHTVGAGMGSLLSVMLLAGYWLYTQPDPSQVALEHQKAARRVIRVTVVLQAACYVTQMILALGFGVGPAPIPRPGAAIPPGTGHDMLQMVMEIVGWAALVAWAVQYFAMMRYTRWVAGRVPDQWIVKRTRRYMWLLPILMTVGMLACGLGPLIALVLYWNLLDRLRKHTKSILASGQPAVLKNMAG